MLPVFLFAVLVSCGYTIVQEKGIFQGEVVSVDVPVFKNRSLEPQVSQFFTEAFTRELVTSGLFDVNKPDAPNILQGSIASVRIVPTTLDKNGLAIEKTVYVTADFALSKKDGRAIKNWSLGDAEPYRVDDINLEDANKKEALKKIAARIARRFSVLVMADIDRKARMTGGLSRLPSLPVGLILLRRTTRYASRLMPRSASVSIEIPPVIGCMQLGFSLFKKNFAHPPSNT